MTMQAVRPKVEEVIQRWIISCLEQPKTRQQSERQLNCYWSPLFETEPLGGPLNQPNYINAVLVLRGKELERLEPSEDFALDLLNRFQALEVEFGRNRAQEDCKWGPRPIDIDLIAWSNLQVKNTNLILPHPFVFERNFVIAPLSAVLSSNGTKSRQLPPRKNWPE